VSCGCCCAGCLVNFLNFVSHLICARSSAVFNAPIRRKYADILVNSRFKYLLRHFVWIIAYLCVYTDSQVALSKRSYGTFHPWYVRTEDCLFSSFLDDFQGSSNLNSVLEYPPARHYGGARVITYQLSAPAKTENIFGTNKKQLPVTIVICDRN